MCFGQLDDYDIWGAIKVWKDHPDDILSYLSNSLLDRKLFKISLTNDPIKKQTVDNIRGSLAKEYKILQADTRFLYSYGEVTNKAYIAEGSSINILKKNGGVIDIANAVDLPNIKAISKIVKKHYLCCPKNVYLRHLKK